MSIGWKNKDGTATRSPSCGKCGSWKDHWKKLTGRTWPQGCSVLNCSGAASLGGHIIHPQVQGEKIVPMCDGCNKISGTFGLSDSVALASAVKCN